MTEIYSYMPDFVPKPITCGKLQDESPKGTFFYLSEFIRLDSKGILPSDVCRLIAQLHETSISPTGKFGFHQATFQGPHEQIVTWEDNWCTYFSRLLLQWFNQEVASNGPDGEYEATYRKFVRDVIPRILEPLQSDGRSLKPCLIHGDLWRGNISRRIDTGTPIVYDACAMYAHNELEAGMWRYSDNDWVRQYFDIVPPSEPAEQRDDRNRLYSIKYILSHIRGCPKYSRSGRSLYEFP